MNRVLPLLAAAALLLPLSTLAEEQAAPKQTIEVPSDEPADKPASDRSASEAIDKAKETTSAAIEAAKTAIIKAIDKAKEHAVSAIETGKEASKEALDKASEATRILDKAAEAARDVLEKAKRATTEVLDKAKDATEQSGAPDNPPDTEPSPARPVRAQWATEQERMRRNRSGDPHPATCPALRNGKSGATRSPRPQ
jgi:hypothetical protein